MRRQGPLRRAQVAWPKNPRFEPRGVSVRGEEHLFDRGLGLRVVVAADRRLELSEAPHRERPPLGGGLRVYTSIDPGSQQRAWDAVHSVLPNPEDPAAALVALDQNGYINAETIRLDAAVRLAPR